MATIAFISPKGGVGKTTAAIILATELALQAKVIVIDADPNRPIARWKKSAPDVENLEVVSDVNQENIIEKIEEASAVAPFVVVDCEGTASLTVSYAIGSANLVIVPTQGSHLDATEASRALALVKNQEKMGARTIPHAVLLTRTNPIIAPRSLGEVKKQLQARGTDLFDVQLNEREAFRAIFGFGRTLETLDPFEVPNVEKAIVNARAFRSEVVQRLRKTKETTTAEGAAV